MQFIAGMLVGALIGGVIVLGLAYRAKNKGWI